MGEETFGILRHVIGYVHVCDIVDCHGDVPVGLCWKWNTAEPDLPEAVKMNVTADYIDQKRP